MAEIEDSQRRFDVIRLQIALLGQLLVDPGGLVAKLGLFDIERFLIDLAGQEGVQQPVLHRGQFAAPLGKRASLIALQCADIGKRRLDRVAEPTDCLGCGQSHRIEVGDNRLFEVVGLPAYGRVIVSRHVVGAAIVLMHADAAIPQLPADSFAK